MIAIKGMSHMPKSCSECQFKANDYVCGLLDCAFSCNHFEERNYNCPLTTAVEKEKIDKAIEEITGYARFHRDKTHNDAERGKYLAYEKCIEILKRNIEEEVEGGNV